VQVRGKTTIVPLFLHKMKNKNIIVVEPRRVATRSAAQRMSSILHNSKSSSGSISTSSKTVGYIIRGENNISSQTQITVMTDGVLLNKLRSDPQLSGVDIVIFDEFHERGVMSDTLLALCREVQLNYRDEGDDLQIVVMSATLLGDEDEQGDDNSSNNNNKKDRGNENENESTGSKLIRILGGEENCNVLKSEGRQYPITYSYLKRGSAPHGLLLNDSKKLISTMVNAIEEGIEKAPSNGSVLAFLQGAKEIRKVVQELKRRKLGGVDDVVDVLPLYGSLPKKEQDLAIYQQDSSRGGSGGNIRRRRVIVSSPIAEASLTIEGVTCVVDSGFRREPRFNIQTGLPRLVTVPCSKDSAIQRAGRAGRTQDGLCIRLFNEAEYNRLDMHAQPEILSTDLVPTILFLADWGCSCVDDIVGMPFVDPPPEDAIEKAFQMLVDLEAVELIGDGTNLRKSTSNQRYRISPHGRKLAALPTHPRFATAIVRAKEEGTTESFAASVIAVALIEEEIGGGNRRQAANLANEIRDVLLQETETSITGRKILQFANRIGPEAYDAVLKAFNDERLSSLIIKSVGPALLPGFIDTVAQLKGDASYSSSTYMLSLGRSARLDGIQNAGDFILVIDTSSGDDGLSRIRSYVPIDIESLSQVAVEKEEFYSVASRGYEVRARLVTKVGALELSSSPIQLPSSEVITQVLIQTIKDLGGVNKALIQNQSKKTKEAIDGLRNRVRLANKVSPDQNWPDCFASLDAIDSMTYAETDEESLLEVVEPWLSAGKSLKNVNMYDILVSSMTPDQLMYLDNFYPTKLPAPDGSIIPLNYLGDVPSASGKLQQFFGSKTTPSVGEPGKSTPISLTLLSPSSKPLAMTMDLPFFWENVYPSVRSEMRGKYPKHPWPEDPLNAVATRLSKKQLMKSSAQQQNEGVDKRKERSKKRKKREK